MTNTIRVIRVTDKTIVTQDTGVSRVISVAQQGPQGIQGVQGLPGYVNYKERDNDYYLTFGIDDVVGMDASNGDVSVFLPASTSLNAGQKLYIKKIDSTSYNVLVKSNGGQLIDNLGSIFTISYHNDEFGFISTGTSYKVF